MFDNIRDNPGHNYDLDGARICKLTAPAVIQTLNLSTKAATHTSATPSTSAPSTLPSAPPTLPSIPSSSAPNLPGPAPTLISLPPATLTVPTPAIVTSPPITASQLLGTSPAPSQPSASSLLPIRPPQLLLTDVHTSSPMGPVANRTRRNRAIHRRNLYAPYSRSSSQTISSQSSFSTTSTPPPISASAPQMSLPSVSTLRRPRG